MAGFVGEIKFFWKIGKSIFFGAKKFQRNFENSKFAAIVGRGKLYENCQDTLLRFTVSRIF